MISWDDVNNATAYELLWRLLDGESEYERIRHNVIRNRTEVTLKTASIGERIAQQYSVKVTSVQDRVQGGTSPELVFNTDLISKCVDTLSYMCMLIYATVCLYIQCMTCGITLSYSYGCNVANGKYCFLYRSNCSNKTNC